MTKKYILIILALSLATHFAFFGEPAQTVFDEVHFGKFVSGYFTGEYFFDIHPPLGKLLIAGMAKLSGFQPGFSFETIGQEYQDNTYKWLRFLPSLAGALLPIVVFLIALELGISQKFAFLAGLLIVFENALLAQSRFILLDSFLLLFGFLAILFYLKFNKTISLKPKTYPAVWLFWAGVFASLAASVKWTGLSFLALIGIFYLFETFNLTARAVRLNHLIKGAVLLFILPAIIYFSIFAVHFSLLSKPGPGSAFHPPNFQEMNVFEKFIELNGEIYRSNARLDANHPYSSQWYEWPLMTRPIFYWNGDGARIYLLGNPLIWWLSIVFVIYSLFSLAKLKNPTYYFLLSGFLINWLPFILIGRVMFLYHYFTSLIFAILILVYLLDKSEFGNKKFAFRAILISSVILFLFFSPLTYGLAIPEWYYKLLVWMPSWK